jgi:hypothetical protein
MFLFLIGNSANLVAQARVNVTTWHNDNWRTGRNTRETILNTTNVNEASFGKLCSAPTDGAIYAQPLIVTGVPFTVGTKTTTHDIAYVVTQNDTVYAFDANNCAKLKSFSLVPKAKGCVEGTTCEQPVDCHYVGAGGCQTIAPTLGILGTPVIDPGPGGTGTIYMVAETQVGAGTSITAYRHRIHALDITNLTERVGSPELIRGTFGAATMESHQQIQRTGLLLLPNAGPNGDTMVYFGMSLMDGSPGVLNEKPYGWVFGYDTTNLSAQPAGLPYVFCTTPDGVGPNGPGGGVWLDSAGIASGFASATDPTPYLFIVTGDGTFDVNTGGDDYADSFVRLAPDLQVSAFFTRYNELTAYTPGNVDMGSGGLMLVPDNVYANFPYVAINASKDGNIYVVNRESPGGFTGSVDTNTQTFAVGHSFFSSPAYWNLNLYYAYGGGALTSYPVKNTCKPGGPICSTGEKSTNIIFKSGTTPFVSSNSTVTGTPIVWALQNAYSATGGTPTILYAFDAVSLNELYDTTQCGTEDTPGFSVKFTTPIVANGKAYVGTQSELDVFGTLAVPRTCP